MTDARRRVALISGATGGIGEAVARRLARDGWNLTLVGRSADRLQNLVDRLDIAEAGQLYCAANDLTEPDAAQQLIADHHGRYPALDALVLAAGTGSVGALDGYPEHRTRRQLEVNFLTPMRLIQAALPALRSSAAKGSDTGARIVAVASISGRYAGADTAAYGASKAALISLCESICVAESAHGVSATAIAPAFVATEMSRWVWHEVAPELMIRPDDVAALTATVLGLSRGAVVPELTVSRAGDDLHRP